MQVKLIANRVANYGHAGVLNSDLSECLRIGSIFHVFSIEICVEATYFYIYDNHYLFPAPSGMFEIVDHSMPQQWRIFRRDESLVICPQLFNEPFFYDRFSEHDKQLRDRFKNLVAEMYPSFEYEEW